jgi:hypothetical protein
MRPVSLFLPSLTLELAPLPRVLSKLYYPSEEGIFIGFKEINYIPLDFKI